MRASRQLTGWVVLLVRGPRALSRPGEQFQFVRPLAPSEVAALLAKCGTRSRRERRKPKAVDVRGCEVRAEGARRLAHITGGSDLLPSGIRLPSLQRRDRRP